MNSGMSSSFSAKDTVGILIGTELNLQIVLIRIDILIVISAPLHAHGICFHLLLSCLISSSNIL